MESYLIKIPRLADKQQLSNKLCQRVKTGAQKREGIYFNEVLLEVSFLFSERKKKRKNARTRKKAGSHLAE